MRKHQSSVTAKNRHDLLESGYFGVRFRFCGDWAASPKPAQQSGHPERQGIQPAFILGPESAAEKP